MKKRIAAILLLGCMVMGSVGTPAQVSAAEVAETVTETETEAEQTSEETSVNTAAAESTETAENTETAEKTETTRRSGNPLRSLQPAEVEIRFKGTNNIRKEKTFGGKLFKTPHILTLFL